MQIVYRVDYPDVSKNVKRLREHRGWSQQTLAVNAGLSIGVVQKVERGIESVEIGTIGRLSTALEERLEALLGKPVEVFPDLLSFSSSQVKSTKCRTQY